MPEGSGLGGANLEVWIVWTSLRCTTLRAEAGGAAQSSTPSAAGTTARTIRWMPLDARRPGQGEQTPVFPTPLMKPRIRFAGEIYAGKRGSGRVADSRARGCAPARSVAERARARGPLDPSRWQAPRRVAARSLGGKGCGGGVAAGCA